MLNWHFLYMGRWFFQFFIFLLHEKIKLKKLYLAPFILLTSFENPFSNPLQRPAAIYTLKKHAGSRL
jgi:hypothetical protein